ncbi:bifunctional histidinol-phosphatase/imidazoleglycerol-phosphate dehydratase HisB [Succinatimonas hippei]|uniref:Histidine biosynthesis bifunctional protein HisB n=1 Tax=Succinatimonas hippei (strain DSM 22608 / JCM 16073 / KCTC 15190 / YIT 12066) TaxID=762983 RepID=E8LMS1_SUCHY|nr:bifunctional histidinol-phosphatase/imidazoleglycerol-phosphate dehydratase HisB [Succinatimonas hippei]EFY06184.1 histidinol-phosphatase [Succinatimonas hippei YIT 12066]
MKKYLFIDRDGTLVREPNDFQVDSLEKISFAPNVIPALTRLKNAGFTFVMVSNQDGLGTSSFPLETFTKPHEFILNTLKSQGITFEQVLICPHFEKDNCDCRKPKLGLVMAYLKDTSWDRAHSYFIGDRSTDLQMGENMGIQSILYHEDSMPWDKIADDLTIRHRIATVSRHTKETKIDITVDLDHHGTSKIDTGMGFFDHMLDQIATHGGFNMDVKVTGDLFVDEHHSIEDTGIALGTAIKEALLDKRGIGRFGFVLPMDEVYAHVFADKLNDDGVTVALDISGRPHCNFRLDGIFSEEKAGAMPVQMVPHFFESLAVALGLTLHMKVSNGNCHHQIEALFKAFGRALRQAITVSGTDLPSSKGTL